MTVKLRDANQTILFELSSTTGNIAVGGATTKLNSAGTVLDLSTIADGEFLKRSGSTVISGSAGGGTPAVSVTDESTFGITPAVGTGTNYARQDHTHGSPSLGTSGTTACAGNDARLSDARTPLAHVHAASDITSGVLAMARLATGTPDGTKFIRDDGTLQTPPGGGGGPSSVKSTADQTKTDATMVNVTGCSFSVTSGVYYKFQFLINFRSSLATVGLKVGLTFPGVTRFACTGQIPIATQGAGGAVQGYITATGGSVIGSAVPAVNTDYLAVLDGIILPSATGTLQLQFAAETTGATVTCRQGTCGVLYTLT